VSRPVTYSELRRALGLARGERLALRGGELVVVPTWWCWVLRVLLALGLVLLSVLLLVLLPLGLLARASEFPSRR
jgi:uncharacterized membrane protein